MVHGIGQRLEKANLVDDVGDFRHITADLAERHLTSYQRNTQRVLFIPCQVYLEACHAFVFWPYNVFLFNHKTWLLARAWFLKLAESKSSRIWHVLIPVTPIAESFLLLGPKHTYFLVFVLAKVVGGSIALTLDVKTIFFPQRSIHLKIGGATHPTEWNVNMVTYNNLNSLLMNKTQQMLKF